MADAMVSKTIEGNLMSVRLRPPAPDTHVYPSDYENHMAFSCRKAHVDRKRNGNRPMVWRLVQHWKSACMTKRQQPELLPSNGAQFQTRRPGKLSFGLYLRRLRRTNRRVPLAPISAKSDEGSGIHLPVSITSSSHTDSPGAWT